MNLQGRRGPGHDRGSLRIYLGAAPGVGKTYAMLREGRRLRSEGRDIVIGLVESHGRKDTELQVEDLELVPRMQVNHRGVVIGELDVEAILARKPEIVLIDELAHSNPPGAERPKRYLDVELLLDHGIDVIATLNVQHLQGMNDLVASITGIEVRETIPDQVLDEADEVHLVDLPVGALINRLEAGKIYPKDRANQALTGFFREGNLTALRELALRRTAVGVDERLTDLMFAHGDGLIVASDRFLVVTDSDERWGGVIRSAWRMASALRGDLLVVTLAPQGALEQAPAERRPGLERNLRLAEDLGAELLVVSDGAGTRDDIADALVQVVRSERISMLVIGVSRGGMRGFLRRSKSAGGDLAQALIDRLDRLDVLLVGYEERT
ncbi:MAG: sensor histidine kinase KdpD [Thermomicrobiales bacterium]